MVELNNILFGFGMIALCIYILYWVLWGQFNSSFYQKDCTCGRHKKCVSKYEVTWNGGIKRHDMFQCGAFQDGFKKIIESPFYKKVSKDIKERGSSGPWP